jgi:glycosidase
MKFRKIAVLITFTLWLLTAQAQVDRIEPPYWWSGMQKEDLQILFYGQDIARYEVQSSALTIKGIIRTENPNYLFVTVDTRAVQAGNYPISILLNDKVVKTIDYVFREREEGSSSRQGFDSSDVIYLLMPDRFANGDPSNDSQPGMTEKANRALPGGRHGGDIQGIIDNLDYIEGLGATAIWSTPLCEDNDSIYSYHTYAQSDVYRIDPRFGTNEDYKRLADELHKLDMKLIMDYVTNHWGLEHWLIQDLPTRDWIHQFPGYGQTNYRMETQMDPHASERDFRYCVEGWFVRSMPDLNQSNPLVLNYLIQNAIWWIEYAGLDGFRVDTYSYNDKEAIARWTRAIMAEYPSFNMVGEVWMHDQAQISYWQKDSPIGALQSYNSYMPAVMDFTLHDAIGNGFHETDPSWDKGMIRIYQNFVNDFLYANPQNLLVFAENHDTRRIKEVYPGFADYRLIMSLIATVRGIPQIYYGSEIGMGGDKGKGDGDIRRDFPGGWPDDPLNAFTVTGRNETQQKYYDFTSRLFNWRKGANVIHAGKMTQYLPRNGVYVYFRYDEDSTVMVVLNNSLEPRVINTDRFRESIGQYRIGKDVLTGKEYNLEGSISLPGKTSLILEVGQ